MSDTNLDKNETVAPVRARLGAAIRKFHREESGVLIAYGVFFILIVLMVGGIGIDLMRFEKTRASLQGTLDRAVLAAADLDQKLAPEDVVTDYFSKSEMADYLASVEVDQGINYRKVAATAHIEMGTQFIHMLGINSLDAPAAGTAEESVDGVEVSLVLDMSGSMGSHSKLDNLQDAAKEFVHTMLTSSPAGDVSISIVPYATQVNLGPTLAQYYTFSGEHDYSYCANFGWNDFNSTSIDRNATLQQTGPFDPWYQVEGNLRLPVCPERAGSEVKAFSMNEGDLDTYIDSFNADGNTSIDIGVKWGTALLDPGTQSVVTDMIEDGNVDAAFAGRPSAYNDDTLKVLVVMSDGENTSQYYLTNNYRSGYSNVWYYDDYYGRVYSMKNGSKYYYKRVSGSRCYPNQWGGCGNIPNYGYTPFEGSKSDELTFPQLFHQASNEYISDVLYYNVWSNSYADSYWRWNAYDDVSGSTKDNRLDDICTAAKNAGIVIYAIGFEAPYGGQRVLESCASSDGHYFDVEGVEISDAFESIASSISKLRLTQ
jgi:Flp pilus assembly protein TadG